MTPLDLVLSRLPAAKRVSGQYVTRCPVHEDRKPSLGIRERDGKVLIRCYAGCRTEDVLASIRLDWSDLFTR